jgi:hypothetical protein
MFNIEYCLLHDPIGVLVLVARSREVAWIPPDRGLSGSFRTASGGSISLRSEFGEREFVNADNQTQDTEQMMAEANSRIMARTDRRSLPSRSPFWLIVYGGFRRATVRLEEVGFLVAHKIKDSNDLCGSCDHLSRVGVAGRRWGRRLTQVPLELVPLSMAVAIFGTHNFRFSRSGLVEYGSSDLYFIDIHDRWFYGAEPGQCIV